MFKASLYPRGCFRQRRFVQATSPRAGAAILEQGRAMARHQILKNHIAPPVATLKGPMLHDTGKRQSR